MQSTRYFVAAAAEFPAGMQDRKDLFRKEKINPMIGAAGISAFPMSSRVIQKMATDEDPQNFILMHAAGANVSGQIASVIAGGLLLALRHRSAHHGRQRCLDLAHRIRSQS